MCRVVMVSSTQCIWHSQVSVHRDVIWAVDWQILNLVKKSRWLNGPLMVYVFAGFFYHCPALEQSKLYAYVWGPVPVIHTNFVI